MQGGPLPSPGAQFNEENQEDVIRLVEGVDVTVHRKGLPDAYLRHTPYIITANTWPWCRFLDKDHVWTSGIGALSIGLPEFAEGVDLHPRVWLDILDGKPAPADNEAESAEFDFDGCSDEELLKDNDNIAIMDQQTLSVLDHDLS